jgi:hypothetical protein
MRWSPVTVGEVLSGMRASDWQRTSVVAAIGAILISRNVHAPPSCRSHPRITLGPRRRAREAELKRAEAEVADAKRRYGRVDPENDLVRAALEADYHAATHRRDQIKQEQTGRSPEPAPDFGDAEVTETRHAGGEPIGARERAHRDVTPAGRSVVQRFHLDLAEDRG